MSFVYCDMKGKGRILKPKSLAYYFPEKFREQRFFEEDCVVDDFYKKICPYYAEHKMFDWNKKEY